MQHEIDIMHVHTYVAVVVRPFSEDFRLSYGHVRA